MNELDIILRYVPRYGWLAMLTRHGHELRRCGAFKATAEAALSAALGMAQKVIDQDAKA
jgi:hypothetical protein